MWEREEYSNGADRLSIRNECEIGGFEEQKEE